MNRLDARGNEECFILNLKIVSHIVKRQMQEL